jgi:hypothetical protein
VIRAAEGHTCSECTHEYKREADEIPQANDPAALVGIDENRNVPAFVGDNDDGEMNVEHRPESSSEDESMDVDDSSDIEDPHSDPLQEAAEHSPVQMVVLDGIVFGPKHCAFENCTADLKNYKTGVFCEEHERIRGNLCRVQNCSNPKVAGTQACHQHRETWRSHVVRFGRSTLLGIRRMLRRSEEENLPWLPAPARNTQPHDDPTPAGNRQKNYFTASRFYCVETITAACGAVIAWTKFAKAESPSNILDFLDRVYPTAESKPDYICIDKACLVLRHAVASGRWNMWKSTSRFIVDSYHYINHRTTDYLCRKYCNPAPLNGSAPNLVSVEYDNFGRPHYKRAYNTQVCLTLLTFTVKITDTLTQASEQLNGWIGGFESILTKMTVGNFNWFLHTMLFMHTEQVIEKQKERQDGQDGQEEVDDDEAGIEIDDDDN